MIGSLAFFMVTHSTAYSEPLQTQHLKLEMILNNAIYVISSGWGQIVTSQIVTSVLQARKYTLFLIREVLNIESIFS